jgi:cellulose synthase/poly-beta-1,6-N-acetylglucosamine synthase-like glycosyltransferase
MEAADANVQPRIVPFRRPERRPNFTGLHRDMPIGDLLHAAGVITASQRDEGLLAHLRMGVRTGEALVALGYATPHDVTCAVAHQRGLDVLDTQQIALAPEQTDEQRDGWYRARRIVPFRRDDGTLCAAMADPDDDALIEEMKEKAGEPVQPVVATNAEIEAMLHIRHRDVDLKESTDRLREQAPTNSAHEVLTARQKVAAIALIAGVGAALLYDWHLTVVVALSVITLAYIAASAYRLYLLKVGWSANEALQIERADASRLDERTLPVYTVLVPLYHETEVLPNLARAIHALDWPKAKLDVRLLLEEDDAETIAAAQAADLPAYFTIVLVPKGGPRGKPKACNYGLIHARGEYVVIFDAEDRPEPDQLKKAYAAFQTSDPGIACFQGRLNFYNAEQNLLTRWFTAEYSMWFDLILPALQWTDAPIPLGGTSNHFRREVLEALGTWDPYNVTEDADLGLRLAKSGLRTAVLDSTTFEEANPAVGNWIRQRSRWIKGFMQTWLVHMRHPVALWRALGTGGFLGFHLILGGTLLVLLLNPLYWTLTVLWFATYWNWIQTLFPGPIYALGLIALCFGNYAFVYLSMAGAEVRGYHRLVKYVLLSPVYWVLMSIAAWKGVLQLFYRPHYWEKTQHGLARATGMDGDVSLGTNGAVS